MNVDLKMEILKKFGSQANFSQAVGIEETRLSRIIHGRRLPSDEERQRLKEIFGARRAGQLLRRPAADAQE